MEHPEYLSHSQGYKALCWALQEKKTDIAKLLVDKGVPLNLVDKGVPLNYSRRIIETDTPLHSAILNSDIELVKLLLEKGANPLAIEKSRNRTALHVAAIVESVDIVKLLFDYGAEKSVNVQNVAGLTPLHIACRRKCLEIVKILLDKGADINSGNDDGCTPLFCAIAQNCLEVFNYLVNHGCDLSVPEGERTALHMASQFGNLEMVNYLLKHININHQDKDGWTPLTCSIKGQASLEVFHSIIEAGADIKAKLMDGTTALHLACYFGNLAMVNYLVKHIDINSENDLGKTPIYFAIKNNHLEIFNLLLKLGADVAVKMKSNFTCLHVACEFASIEMVSFLLSHIGVNLQDNKGCTPLHCAIVGNQLEVFNHLINSNADITMYKNDSPLHLACATGNMDMITYAMKYFDVNIENDIGETPLHVAVSHGCLEAVKFLLNTKNIDVNHKTKDGSTALFFACYAKRLDLVEILLEANADVNLGDGTHTPLYTALMKDPSLDIIKMLVKYGADVNLTNEACYYMTPLHYASYRGDCNDIARFLVEECNADITLRNCNNRTALNFAAFGNNLDLLKFLLKAGADPDILDLKDTSPLLSSCRQGLYEIVDTLLEYNADTNLRTIKHGSTALHTAAFHNQLDIIKLLLKYNADINAEDKYGKIAFHSACQAKNWDIVTFLLDAGSNIEKATKYRMTFESSKVVEKHVAKLRAANIYVDKNIMVQFLTTQVNDFYEECLREVALLKCEKPGDQEKVSFYDILSKHPAQVEFYAKNPQISNCVKWKDLNLQFPIYGDVICCKFTKVLNSLKNKNKAKYR